VHEGIRPWRHIGIYRPEELSAMLTGLESKWIPFVALGAFAGLRTARKSPRAC
jgi:hypothetical protein